MIILGLNCNIFNVSIYIYLSSFTKCNFSLIKKKEPFVILFLSASIEKALV